MADIFTAEQRGKLMSAIKSKNTRFELFFLKHLSARLYPKGYRYRKHYKLAVGKPDVVFVKHKVAVFLDSDFWHGKNFVKLRPRLKNEFWVNKILRNIARDKKVNRTLGRAGWKVVRLNETQVKKYPLLAIQRIEGKLRSFSEII